MKRIILFAVGFLLVCPVIMAENKLKKEPAKEAHINWLTIDELQVKMREKPKKVYMDMYTDWCGWCKKMEASTFSNPDVIKYMNEHFYCVRFNAERRDTFRFMGKQYYFEPEKKVNNLAFELMRGQLSYPTSIFFEELFQNAQPVAGYQDVKGMELLLKFFGENSVKNQQQWLDSQKNCKPTWVVAPDPVAPPAGH